MNIRSISSLMVLALLGGLASSATAAYLPNWTQQSYSIYQDVNGGENPAQYTDIKVSTVSGLPIADSLLDIGSGSTASGSSSLAYVSGVFTARIDPYSTSLKAANDQFGYALSSAALDNRFLADTSSLLLNYQISGSMSATNPDQYLNYASFWAGFFVEDVLLGYNSRQSFTWSDLYDDDATGSFSHLLDTSGTSTILLTPGREYRIAWDTYADVLSTGTSDAGANVSVVFSFATPGASIPEPTGFTLLALGLVGLAGMQRRRRLM